MTISAILITLLIAVPWLGAIVVWQIGDNKPKAQHSTAVVFALLTAGLSITLLFFPQCRSGNYNQYR